MPACSVCIGRVGLLRAEHVDVVAQRVAHPQALEQVATRFGIPPETLAIDWTLVRASLENGVVAAGAGL